MTRLGFGRRPTLQKGNREMKCSASDLEQWNVCISYLPWSLKSLFIWLLSSLLCFLSTMFEVHAFHRLGVCAQSASVHIAMAWISTKHTLVSAKAYWWCLCPWLEVLLASLSERTCLRLTSILSYSLWSHSFNYQVLWATNVVVVVFVIVVAVVVIIIVKGTPVQEALFSNKGYVDATANDSIKDVQC